MKWAITADLQFDEQRRYSTLLEDGTTSRLRDSIDCFEWIIGQAVTLGCDGLLLLGDIFDSRTSINVAVLDRVSRAFVEAQSHLRVVVLVGNHDSYLRTPAINSAQIFHGLADVMDEPFVEPPFAFLPWMEEPEAIKAAVKKLAKNKEARFLCTHLMLKGAVPAEVGYDPAILMPERWDGILLGDVHDPVRLEFKYGDQQTDAQYVGSPMQWHFGDAGGKRGFWILDTSFAPGMDVTFVPNHAAPEFHIVRTLKDAQKLKPKSGDFVRIVAGSHATGQKILKALKDNHVTEESVRLENLTPPLDTSAAKPRLKVGPKTTDKQMLTDYVLHFLDLPASSKNSPEVEELVKIGLNLLEESE